MSEGEGGGNPGNIADARFDLSSRTCFFFTSIQTLALGFYIYLIRYIFDRFLLIPQTYSGGHLTFYGEITSIFKIGGFFIF